MQVEISIRLGQIVDKVCRHQGTMSLFEDFMDDFIDESDFMDYFKATWYPKIGWCYLSLYYHSFLLN